MTGVRDREDEGWRLIRFHASIGVANDESFGENLTLWRPGRDNWSRGKEPMGDRPVRRRPRAIDQARSCQCTETGAFDPTFGGGDGKVTRRFVNG